MPSWFPENNTALASDGEQRSAQKWNSLLYDSVGPKSLPCFPEGTQPLASDDIERSLKKIDTLLGGGSSGPSHHTGHGSPEGVVSACVGDTYTDLDTGLNWTKTSGGCTSTGWTPQYSDNPANYANLKEWFRANYSVLDLGLNPCVDGSSVGKWNNYNGSSFVENSGTPGHVPPIFHTNVIGSQPIIRFIAGSDALSFPNLLELELPGNYTIICVATITGDSFVFGNALGNDQIRIDRSGANILSAFDTDTEPLSTTLPNPASDLRMMVWRRSGGFTSFYQGTIACGSSALGGLGMEFNVMPGAEFGFFNGDLAEIVAYTSDIGVPALASLYNNYFKAKYPSLV